MGGKRRVNILAVYNALGPTHSQGKEEGMDKFGAVEPKKVIFLTVCNNLRLEKKLGKKEATKFFGKIIIPKLELFFQLDTWEKICPFFP